MERWCPLTVKLSSRSTATITAPGVGATARLFPYMGWSSAIRKGRSRNRSLLELCLAVGLRSSSYLHYNLISGLGSLNTQISFTRDASALDPDTGFFVLEINFAYSFLLFLLLARGYAFRLLARGYAERNVKRIGFKVAVTVRFVCTMHAGFMTEDSSWMSNLFRGLFINFCAGRGPRVLQNTMEKGKVLWYHGGMKRVEKIKRRVVYDSGDNIYVTSFSFKAMSADGLVGSLGKNDGL
ncbi:hypothetical protein Tco_0624237 [Tanacetum coccineum]|uniref:Uncharacterized protein n=1 Tax=Tanacetum coccineum TaxID=301880 RepID=A0ABQ4WDG2_9ASTR